MEELGGPLLMRLGKCVFLKEADSLLGYTDWILRDLKNAEMAIREINSTWHDTARGWVYHRAPPAPQPDLTPRRAGDHSRFLLRHSRHLLYRKLLGRLRGWARRGTAIVGGILFLGIAPATSSAYAAGVTVP